MSEEKPRNKVKKPNKRKHADDDPDQDINFVEDKQSKKKRKRLDKEKQDVGKDVTGSLIYVENDILADSKKKSKGKKGKHGDGNEVLDISAHVDGEEVESKPKKRKKHDHKSEEPKKEKKKRENKTGFPDPEQDSSEQLNEQSRKALAYAFAQFHRPSKWKFNKARQNWLIRNLWSTEMIPELYHPLVVKYLSNVQGGTREKLLKSCNDILSTAQPTTETGQGQAVDSVQSNPNTVKLLFSADSVAQAQNIKKALAKNLLDALNRSVPS